MTSPVVFRSQLQPSPVCRPMMIEFEETICKITPQHLRSFGVYFVKYLVVGLYETCLRRKLKEGGRRALARIGALARSSSIRRCSVWVVSETTAYFC